ncbi:MAG: 30S ribosomal protein S1 [Thermoleophilia bacterium]|nr:30S ribosomal protein S1 [Thermoleophilia bacterium]
MSTIEIPVLEDGVWIVGPDGELIPDYDATFPTINEGEVVHGTVVRVDKDEVLVDIGYKSEGVIPLAELSIRRAVNPADEVSLGEEIDALVMTKEDADGRLILSKKRARFELAWKAIEAAAESGEPVNGRVIEVVKGGLILDLGVRGFLPASLIDIRRVQDLDEFTGQELRCKVIELNRSRNNVVLSRRAILEDERKEMRQGILDRLNPGDVVDGQISNIVDFGAFVDLDGMDGLIHISELSWSHVNHPSEILEIGQAVKVKVLDIDRERQRISLGLKQTQSDPWQQVLESYHEEDVVEGRVTKVVTFGAFVEILPGVEGLVHISELAQHHVENPREVVSQGDPVNVLILEIDGDRRRLSLSLKRVEEGAEPLPRADGGESVHLTPNLRLSEEAFPEGADVDDERREGEAMSDTENEVVELAEAALALDADAEDRVVAAVVAEEIAIELAEEAVIVEAVAIELAEEAVIAEEIAIELAEEAVIVEAVAIELAEEAVVADAVAQELAIEALEADAAGDIEAAVELAEEAIVVEEIAIELAEEAIVADAVAIELAEEAIVADVVAIELAEEAIVADVVAIELAEEAIVEEAVAEELAEEAVALADEDSAA